MKTVVLIRSNPVSPDPPVEKMANTLCALGYSVLILAWDRSDEYIEKQTIINNPNGKYSVIRFGIKAEFGGGIKRNFIPLLKFQLRIKNWLKQNREKYDIIHSFDFDTGYISMKIAQKYKKKFIYHILDYYVDAHNSRNRIIKSLVEHMENSVISFADATIICTDKRKEQIKGSKPQKLYVIHNTPDSDISLFSSSVICSNNDKMKIVYIGILAPSRMILELCSIISSDSRFEFHIGGFGKLESKIENIASENNNIYFYGKLPYEKTLKLESECDVMVAIYNPSIKNNKYAAPNKFYESLMMKKPIIMAKGTGFDDIIIENKIGFLCEYNEESIRQTLNKMYIEKNNWTEMGNRGNALYAEYYSWGIMKERIKSVYNNL